MNISAKNKMKPLFYLVLCLTALSCADEKKRAENFTSEELISDSKEDSVLWTYRLLGIESDSNEMVSDREKVDYLSQFSEKKKKHYHVQIDSANITFYKVSLLGGDTIDHFTGLLKQDILNLGILTFVDGKARQFKTDWK